MSDESIFNIAKTMLRAIIKITTSFAHRAGETTPAETVGFLLRLL